MRRTPPRLIALAGASVLLVAQLTLAEEKSPSTKAAAKKPKMETSAASKAGGERPARGGLGGTMPIQLPGIDLPAYQPPESYSVDYVIHSPDGELVMKRSIDKGRTRTEMSSEGHDMIMIEVGDEKGTTYTLMPEDKRAMKTSLAAMREMTGKQVAKKPKQEATVAPSDLKVEDLGDETLDGRAVKKLRMSVSEGSALGWFDKANGAPVRFETTVDDKKTTMDWKNYRVAPQPEKLFVVPKDYEVTDMDEMLSQMKGMGGMGGLAGMAGGMAGGMASGMAQNYGQTMGGSLGASLGAALGGPIGAIAGQYIGGQIGGMVAKKAADVVIPGR